jgi:hypothetical protein
MTCGSAAGSGQLKSGTSGELKITYKECSNRTFGNGLLQCTSAGQSPGTVVTANLSVTPVYLDAAKTIWGLKLTPIGTSLFAECTLPAGGIRRFTGSVIGNVWNSVGSTTKGLSLHQGWGSSWLEQEYQQIEGAGTKYHLQETMVAAPPSKEEWNFESALWLENLIATGASVTINP